MLYECSLLFPLSLSFQGPRWQSGNTLASHLWGRGSIPSTASSGKADSCLPLVGSLQYRTLTNCMYWFPPPFQLPVVIWPVQCWKRRKTPNKSINKTISLFSVLGQELECYACSYNEDPNAEPYCVTDPNHPSINPGTVKCDRAEGRGCYVKGQFDKGKMLVKILEHTNWKSEETVGISLISGAFLGTFIAMSLRGGVHVWLGCTKSPGIGTVLYWRPPDVHIFGTDPFLV